MQITCGDTASDPALDATRGCTPGCFRSSCTWCSTSLHSAQCSRSATNYGLKVACAFAPRDLDDMLVTYEQTRRGYNELILDARVYKANLPRSLEAVLDSTRACHAPATHGGYQRARCAHASSHTRTGSCRLLHML